MAASGLGTPANAQPMSTAGNLSVTNTGDTGVLIGPGETLSPGAWVHNGIDSAPEESELSKNTTKELRLIAEQLEEFFEHNYHLNIEPTYYAPTLSFQLKLREMDFTQSYINEWQQTLPTTVFGTDNDQMKPLEKLELVAGMIFTTLMYRKEGYDKLMNGPPSSEQKTPAATKKFILKVAKGVCLKSMKYLRKRWVS